MHNGFIALHRRIIKSAVYKDSHYVHLWIHLLLSANYTEQRVKITGSDKFITLQPGQLITGRKALSEQTGIQESKVDRILNALKSEQQIEQQTFTKYRVISITNWTQYQQREQQIEQQMNNKRTTDEQQMNTNNKVNKVNKVKKVDKVNKEFLLPICLAWKAFVEMRVRIKKPMTDYAMNLRVKDLHKLVLLGEDPIDVLNQSTSSNYQDLYQVKSNINRFQDTPAPKKSNTARALEALMGVNSGMVDRSDNQASRIIDVTPIGLFPEG